VDAIPPAANEPSRVSSNGVPPAALAAPAVARLLHQSCQIYGQQFRVILAVVMIVWTPLELLRSYIDALEFKEEPLRSLKFALFLINFVGIVATAGVICITHEALRGRPITAVDALGIGCCSWGRLLWTSVLAGVALMGGLILLVAPAMYLLVRCALLGPVAVIERVAGTTALHRSFALTRFHFWLLSRLVLLLLGGSVLVVGCLVLGQHFIPGLDHWLADAILNLISDVVCAFGAVLMTVTYDQLSREPVATPPPSDEYEYD
jgi:hypothetical protein